MNFFLWFHAFENMEGYFGYDTNLEAEPCGTIYFKTAMEGIEVWIRPDRMCDNYSANVVFEVVTQEEVKRTTEFTVEDNSWDELREWVTKGLDLPLNVG